MLPAMPETIPTSTKISGSSVIRGLKNATRRRAQGVLGGGPGGGVGGGREGGAMAVDQIAVGIELGGQEAQKALAPGGVEREVAAPELGGPRPGGNLAAAAVEAAQHLLAQPRDVGFGQGRPRRTRQDAERRAGKRSPGAAQL